MEQKNKIKKRKQFNYIFKSGQAVHSSSVTLVFTKGNNKDYKIGFSASKKVGNSVMRNRARRRMREAARKNEQILSPKICYIFIAKETTPNIDFEKLCKDFSFVINKANEMTQKSANKN